MKSARTKKKLGRNDACPCGSGMKYKKCHGVMSRNPNGPSTKMLKSLIESQHIKEIIRQSQQGRGKPIISAEHQGYRFTAVGNQVHYAKTHNTFIDFLGDYIRSVFGTDWGNAEIRKPLSERHTILQWYDAICTLQKKTMGDNPGGVHTVQNNGLISAYFGLAYNLYLLQHNVELQQFLINRLKRSELFYAAYYETYVAAWFILAGFSLHLENEQDSRLTHPEFIATRDGQSFSVEAKARQAGKENLDVGNQLYKALLKDSHYPRVVFIDLNVGTEIDPKRIASEVTSSIRGREGKLKVKGKLAPHAHVFVTNQPYHLALEETNLPRFCLAVGFNLPDFGYGAIYNSYTEAHISRQKYAILYDVMESMGAYKIPMTFDGEIPEFAFGEAERRFTVGSRVKLSKETLGTLQSGIVVESEKKAYLVVSTENGQSHIVTVDLTESEIAAYRAHPQTFFGRVEAVQKSVVDPLDLYEFFINGYKATPRDRLLEFMAGAPDIEILRSLPREKLLQEYAERLTRSHSRDMNN